MNLAYSGLYLTVVWILFYELDQIAIAKFIGAEKVAIYAIALTFLSLFRNIFGIVFTPFNVRANHYVGSGDTAGLRNFVDQVLILTAPIVLLPTIAFSIVAKPFILSWVGPNYLESIGPATLLALYFSFSFISYTAGMIQYAKEQVKVMNIIGTVNPIIYWLGVWVTYKYWGLMSFAIFKLLAAVVIQLYCLHFIRMYMGISWGALLNRFIKPLLLPTLFVIGVLELADRVLPLDKSRLHLLLTVVVTGSVLVAGFAVQYATSSSIRNIVKNIFPLKKLAS